MSRKRTSQEITSTSLMGSIRIGAKRRRGVLGDRDAQAPGFRNIDVTSGSHNKLGNVQAKTLSPFTLGPVTVDEKTVALTFEAWWQGSKAWQNQGHIQVLADGSLEPTAKWRLLNEREFARTKGRRQPFGLKRSDGPATTAFFNGRAYGYLESRPLYVQQYRVLIEKLPIMDELEKLVRSGVNVMIIDGDGPPKAQYPQGLEINKNNWERMLQDASAPFGHSYVVARVLAERCVPELFE